MFAVKRRRHYVILILLSLFHGQVIGQLDTEHYIPPVHARDLAGTHYLVLGTPVSTTFNVTVTDGSGNFLASIPISNATSSTTMIGSEYSSPFMVSESQLNTIVSGGKGLILTASEPFYANIRALVNNQAGSLTSKGSGAAFGTDFRVGHMFNNTGSSDVKSSFFSLMAKEDNTLVTVSDIKSGVVLRGVAPGTTTINMLLNAGESYVASAYMNESSATNNTLGLNGTHITSDKDIVVNCGSWLGGNALDGTSPTGTIRGGKDIGIDQIVPIDVIGEEYVLIKGFGIDNERTIVVASADNTQLYINGGTAIGTLQAGDYYVIEGTAFSSNDNLYLTASAPIYVTQTTNGESGYAVDNEHHGGMNFIPPVKCTGELAVTIPNVAFIGQAYINIIADAGAVITANGNTITGPKAIPGTSDYVTYSFSGYSSDVNLVSTAPIRVSLINLNGNVGAAGYFSGFSKAVNMNASYQNNGVVSSSEIAEGCGSGTIVIERLSIYANTAITINLQASGSAQEGVDYSTIPTQVSMSVGQTQVSFQVDAFDDNLTEGIENVVISLDIDGNYCIEDDITFTINDVPDLAVTLEDQDLNCLGDSILLVPEVNGGLAPYYYEWSNGSTSEQLMVGPSSTTNFTIMVTDVCAIDTVYATATVTVPDNTPVVFAGNDQTVLCPYTPFTLVAEATGGNPDYAYQWFENGSYVSNEIILSTFPPITTVYVVEITDQCGISATDTVVITVTTPLMELTTNEDRLICPYDETELWCQVSGGLPPFNYYWTHSGETDSNVWVNPGYSSTYEVTVTDACNTYSLSAYPYVEVSKPIADFDFLSSTQVEGLPIYFDNNSVGSVSWEWDLGNGDYSTLFSPGTTYEEDGTYIVTLIAINEMGCADTLSKPMIVKPEFWFYAPNAFTPDGSQFNSVYSVSVIGAIAFNFKIFNRWGELIFESDDPEFEWDGTYNGQIIQDNVYVYTAVIVGEDNETREYSGHISLLK